jgi:hypothetical protein
MPQEAPDQARPATPHTNESTRLLLERVKAGSDLSRSPRLRQLLEYLYEKSSANGGPSEEQIGVDVFGRRRGYDTATDTIVRVGVSQLRRKLEHYFLSEGTAEPVVIDLPKRSYTPVFRAREQPPPVQDEAEQGKKRPGPKAVSVWLGVLLTVCLALTVWLTLENGQLRDRLTGKLRATPYQDHFWSQMFRGGRQTQLVTSDSMAMMLCDYLQRPLTVAEYIDTGYPGKLIDAKVPDPAVRAFLQDEMDNYVTSVPDLWAATRISQIAEAEGGHLGIVFAREFRYQPHNRDNLILLSHPKANPWVSLFEKRLNFRYEFRAANLREEAAIINLAPKPGEQARYPVTWSVQTYAVIAYLHKPVGEGSVLMLEGGDVGSLQAGCDLLADETRIKNLYDRLKLRPRGPLPEFEILLSVKILRASVLDYEVVAYRVLPK